MPANTPQDVHRLFAELFAAADLDGLISMYEPDAVLMPEPGKTVSGPVAIRESLQHFLGMNGKFEIELKRVIEAGDIALLYSTWTLNGKGDDGSDIELSGKTSDVVRLQPDGTWMFVIDNPYGGDGAIATESDTV
jgi:ketosteroid isomerase-like protein